MLHYPSYPDGRIIRPGDIYSFDAGTQLGLVLYVYPNEAIVREMKNGVLTKFIIEHKSFHSIYQ